MLPLVGKTYHERIAIAKAGVGPEVSMANK